MRHETQVSGLSTSRMDYMVQVAKKASWKPGEGAAMPSAAGDAEERGQPCLEAYTPEGPAPISQACASPEVSLQFSGESPVQHLLHKGLHVDSMPIHDQRRLSRTVGHMESLLQGSWKQRRHATVWLPG